MFNFTHWPSLWRLMLLQEGAGGETWDTVTGEIVTFNTVRSAPLRSLLVTLTPQQNLNGYANPWPAGGGKNLFDKTATDTRNGYVSGQYIQENGTTAKSGNYDISEYIPVTAETQYTLSSVTGNAPGYGFYDSEKTLISAGKYGGNTTVTFTTPANTAYLKFSIPRATIDSVQLEAGSSATAYAPYSNICPISGYSALNVYETGTNLLDDSLFQTNAWNKYGVQNFLRPNTTYRFRVNGSTTYTYKLYMTTSSGSSGADAGLSTGYIGTGLSQTFTTPSDMSGYPYLKIGGNASGAGTDTAARFQITLGSDDVPFNEFVGTSIPITIPTPPGTVYGGTLDVVTGVLTVTHRAEQISSVHDTNGNEVTWSYDSGNNIFRTNKAVVAAGTSGDDTGIICSVYKARPYSSLGAYSTENSIIWAHTTGLLLVKDNRFTDATAWLNSVGTETVCYPLVTPVTYQLTPEEVTALVGTNNIWADSGTTVTVEYRSN